MSEAKQAPILKAVLAVALSYWAACAVLLPVTTWDSQVYNLGRLLIAEKAGFWSNTCWYSERQVIFPWTFDAVHYPLVKLGFGEALPSFLCLLGTLIIVYKMLRDFYTERLALWTCLALISMPTFIYQATSTKNDFVIVFLMACWLYAIYRYKTERKNWLMAACALSLGFMFGAKTTGVFFSLPLSLVTVFIVRRWKPDWRIFFASLAASVFLFGSFETYFLSYFRYGSPLGPSAFIKAHANPDGLRGALANLMRYYIGNISPGIYTGKIQQTFCGSLEGVARFSLHTVGLSNTGYGPGFQDSNLQFRKTGADDSSDFGISGWLAFSLCLTTVYLARFGSVSWTTAATGIAALTLVCWTVAWMPWNDRFLVLPFSLFAVAALIFTFTELTIFPSLAQRVLQISILLSIALTPFISWARRPQDVINSFWKRQELTFSEDPSLLPIYTELQRIAKQKPEPIVYLLAGSDSWVLEFLRIKNIRWKLVNALPTPLETGEGNDSRVYAVVLDVKAPANLGPPKTKQVVPHMPIWEFDLLSYTRGN